MATIRGPLELACRDAGLLPCAESIQYLEDLALRLKMAPESGALTPKHLRAAARKHRQMIERGATWVHKTQEHGTYKGELGPAKALVRKELGITSGRQWKRFKKDRQKQLRAEFRAEREAARGH